MAANVLVGVSVAASKRGQRRRRAGRTVPLPHGPLLAEIGNERLAAPCLPMLTRISPICRLSRRGFGRDSYLGGPGLRLRRTQGSCPCVRAPTLRPSGRVRGRLRNENGTAPRCRRRGGHLSVLFVRPSSAAREGDLRGSAGPRRASPQEACANRCGGE